MRTGAQKAQAGHTGIDLDVDAKRPAETGGLPGVFFGLGKTGHGLGDVVADQGLGIFRRRVAEDQDRQENAVLAQFHRLVKPCDSQVVRSGVLQQPRDLHRAVAVGVRLDHAQKPAAVGKTAPDRQIIVADIGKIDFSPGPFPQIIHIVMSPRESCCFPSPAALHTERDRPAHPAGQRPLRSLPAAHRPTGRR